MVVVVCVDFTFYYVHTWNLLKPYVYHFTFFSLCRQDFVFLSWRTQIHTCWRHILLWLCLTINSLWCTCSGTDASQIFGCNDGWSKADSWRKFEETQKNQISEHEDVITMKLRTVLGWISMYFFFAYLYWIWISLNYFWTCNWILISLILKYCW